MAKPRRDFKMIRRVRAYRERKPPLSIREIAKKLKKDPRQVSRWASYTDVDTYPQGVKRGVDT